MRSSQQLAQQVFRPNNTKAAQSRLGWFRLVMHGFESQPGDSDSQPWLRFIMPGLESQPRNVDSQPWFRFIMPGLESQPRNADSQPWFRFIMPGLECAACESQLGDFDESQSGLES
ncbi:putative phospholipase A(2) [Helianthus annuus]|uniref:Phospholipase A(2) n=1 Tax=Helianthus annuus TaxID=4232 RepID=A0A9K3N8J2_HELAN|nr:putative phospholipase A(2) [Helianthus annuus]